MSMFRADVESIAAFVESDTIAMTYQSLGQYRRDLLKLIRVALALSETEAEPVAWLNRYHAAMVTQDRATANAMGFTTPLYAHPPRDVQPPTEGSK